MLKSSSFLDHSSSDFVLTGAGTGRRDLFRTTIDGPWANQLIRATYADDGIFEPQVVKIEILREGQFPGQVGTGHAGWIGSAQAKRRPPLSVDLVEMVFMIAGVFAKTRVTNRSQPDGEDAAPSEA